MAFNLGMTWAQLLANIAQNASDITDLWGEVDKLKIVTEDDDYSTVSAYVQSTPIPIVVFTDGNGGLFPYAGTYNDSHYFGRVKQVSDDEADVVYEIAYIEQDSTWRVGDATPLAPIYSPNFGGNPTAPTRSANDNSTKIATTAYADRAAEMAGYSAFITETESGDIVSFTDGANGIPVKAFTGSIIPQQNLNGQASPYPAGGGANKWDEQWEVGGISQETGQNSSASNTIRAKNICACSPSTTYYLGTNVAAIYWYGTGGSYISFDYNNASGNVRTSPSTATGFRILMKSGYGTTYHNDIAINYPSTVTTYSPYANICPISGWTGANIYRTGVNVWDEQWEVGGMLANTLNAKNLIPVKAGETYCFHNGAGASFNFKIFNAERAVIQSGINLGNNGTYTMPSGAAFIQFRMTSTYGTTYNNDISINYPSTDTAYHAYNGQTILLSFGQTVYAGTLTALGGGLWKIQPTHAIYTVTGAEAEWTDYSPNVQINKNVLSGRVGGTSITGFCSMVETTGTGRLSNTMIQANSSTGTYLRCIGVIGATAWGQSFADLAAWKTWLATQYTNGTPLQVCYELAEASRPDPITITGEDLQTLLGANTVWTDVGSVTGMTYRADTALYIDKKLGA